VSIRVALAVGLALVAIAVGLVFSSSPRRVAGTNSVITHAVVALTRGGGSVCQSAEELPSGTSAMRLSLLAVIGPSVTLTAWSRGHILTRGTSGAGWTGAQVTVPVQRIQHATPDVKVCFTLGQSRETISVLGQRGSSPPVASSAQGATHGRMQVEYLTAGDRSWWSQALSVARRIGLGRAPSGTWVVVLLASLMAVIVTLASYLCIRELGASNRTLARRRVPSAAWVCALVAFLNAVCWSILSPPFQVPDEPAHFAYVQQLAEVHQLPAASTEEYSPEEEVALEDLHHDEVQFTPGARTISSRAQERKLEADLRRPLARTGSGGAGTAADEPPLYYALETIPYYLGSGGTLLDRLELMRLLSALFGGLTAFFAFLFVRETLPGTPWAWTVGGLGVALAPLLGFMSGAVNPDAMLFAVSAALFFLLARAFRSGLTNKLATAIGTVIAIGLLTKLNFLGLAPGAVAALIVLTIRARWRAWRGTCIALAVAASPVLLYIVVKPLTNQAPLNISSNPTSQAAQAGSVLSQVSYIWQLYLPRLPGMTNYFPGIFTSRQLWFNGLVGLYGWAETAFPGWVDDIALVPAGALALLTARALVGARAALRRHIAEPLLYATMGVGVMAIVGAASYESDVINNQGPFWEPRYLLPMVVLFGAALALAARGAGRRWGPTVGVLIIVLILAHDLFSQLLVVSRYYS
jgi:hypothetical protein